jgi:heme/copper-type cytochrome/quinol oxidase subunit 4
MAGPLISPGTQRRTNSALWYGLLITLAGIATQFLYFLRLPPPVPHVLPWINLLLPAFGLIYVIIGLVRAFNQSAVYAGKIWGSVLTVIALLVVAGNTFLFRQTRAVPSSAGAPQVGQHLPEFTVPDSSGEQTSLSQLFAVSANGSPPKAVLLVFYRGYW